MLFTHHPVDHYRGIFQKITSAYELLNPSDTFSYKDLICTVLKKSEKGFNYTTNNQQHPRGWMSWEFYINVIRSYRINISKK